MSLNPKNVGVALFTLVNATVALLLALGAIDWTDEQTAGTFLAINSGIALAVAVLAHFKVGTPSETVAIQGGTVAVVTSTLAVFVLFDIVTLSVDSLALVGGVVVALFALGGSLLAREAVTPVSQ